MAKLADNMKEGLESELKGLEARLEALGDDAEGATVANLKRRIGEVKEALGARRAPATLGARRAPAKKESRPA